MTSLAPAPPNAAPVSWWLWLHQRLMPDYNRRAAAYWWAMVTLGAAVIAHSLHQVAALPPNAWIHTAGGTLLAMLAGLVPVRIPRTTNSFTAGEIFLFLLLLLHGAEAASLAAACEAMVGSARASRRWTSRIASPAMAGTAMFVAGSLLQAGYGALKPQGLANDALLLLGAIAFSVGYFVLNTVMVTTVARLKRGEPLRARAFIDSFGWLGVAYAGNASVATLLYLSFRHSGIVVVIAAVPIIVILLTTGHYHFRREEAAEAVRQAREQQAAQRQMMEHARQAGMAEIATNVLHNVGNVLNSVNVSAELIQDRVARSESPGLLKAVQLMEAQADRLGDYLANDPRGRLIPAYLRQLAEALSQERQTVLDELATLACSVRHIKEIVATQQSYAGASSIVEPARIADLVEDALRINAAALDGGQASIEREFGDVPTLLLDKHRILLILVNLIGNARHALRGVPAGERRITLCVAVRGDALQVIVADNGEGIAADNLTRIFAHGFTTKKDGHGFGLHSCVLAAREMSGTLSAASDGPGRGARFTLELPLNQPADPR